MFLFQDDQGFGNNWVWMIRGVQNVRKLCCSEFSSDERYGLVGLAGVSIKLVLMEIESDNMMVGVGTTIHCIVMRVN